MSDLVNRLRGIYSIPVNDGGGLLDGSDTFTRNFETPPIQQEAANRIEILEKQVSILESQVETLVNELDSNP